MVRVDTQKCIGCGTCVPDCQPGVIHYENGKCTPNPEVRCLECGHCAAVCPQNAIEQIGYDPAEIMPYDPETFDITPDRLMNFIRFRRSIRQFKKDPVPKELIEKIIETGRYTQTGGNLQQLRYVVLAGETMEKVRKISNSFLATLDMNTINMDEIRLSSLTARMQPIWKAWNEIYETTGKDMLLHDAPHHLLIVTYKSNEIDAAINLGNMELMINALGLGACCTGFATFAYAVSPELRELVGLQENETVAFSMTFGYPDVSYLRTTNRKPANWQII